MKTLLIVEDEKMIRQGLHVMIKRSGVPVDVILECKNGEEALEVLSYQQVDVMFTDIRMPRMDGIELVRRVQELPEKPLIVAVSGYDDFSYAVEMLRNGVKEYLLKPVDRDRVSQVMHQLEEELTRMQKTDEKERMLGKQQMKYLMSGAELSGDEMSLLKQKYAPYFYQTPFVVCCAAREAGDKENSAVVFLPDVDEGMVYVLEEENLSPFLRNEFPESCVGISTAYQGLENLRRAYEEAGRARKRAFCTGRAVTFGEEEKKIPEELKVQAAKLMNAQNSQQRIQLAGSGRTEELDNQWGKLFSEVEKERISAEDFFKEMKRSLEELVNIYGEGMGSDWTLRAGELGRFMAFSDLGQYREAVMEWIMELHRKKNREEEGHGADKKMQLAVAYIEENYNKNLNMAVVSNYLSMNYSQFSYSFKQYTGTSFVNYMKEIRIREAKKLLQDTDLKVQEISARVGYDNEKHFMKTFRGQCGVSPSEYRRNMRKDDWVEY